MTRTSRSTRSGVPRCAASSSSRATSPARRQPADVVALRHHPAVRASGCSRRRSGWPGGWPSRARIDAAAREAFLSPVAAAGPFGDGRVEVATYETERAEAEHLADLLRRAHLEDGIAWDEMAVLVRSGRTSIPGLRRALGAAGVPVEVASDDVPLVRDPAVLPMLDALRAVLNLDNDDRDHVEYVDPGRAEALLTGPLGGLDAGDVRRLARALRIREKELTHGPGPPPARRASWSARAVVEPGFLDGLSGPAADRAPALPRSCSRRPARARRRCDRPRRCSGRCGRAPRGRSGCAASVGRGGASRPPGPPRPRLGGARSSTPRPGPRSSATTLGVRNFLATLVAQQIPADTLAERGVRGAAVRLLTAHRAKGLEWRLVVVAHVQAGRWPDLRRRSTLLQADRIGARRPGAAGHARELLLEERGCSTSPARAPAQRLVVTAVASPEDDGEQPSRFLGELGRDGRGTSRAGRRGRSRWRAWSASCGARSPIPRHRRALREAAARRLARPRGRRRDPPAGAQADPATWWGTRPPACPRAPCATPTGRCRSRPACSSRDVCPAQWFLARRGRRRRARPPGGQRRAVVHALAERVAAGSSRRDPATSTS